MENENCNTNQLTYYELMRMIISLSLDGRDGDANILAKFTVEKFPEKVFGRGGSIVPVENREKSKDSGNL